VKEFDLRRMYRSPNGTIRNFLGGIIFREPIVCQNTPKFVPNWTHPICIGRHVFTDQYRAIDFRSKGEGKLTISFTPDEAGEEQTYKVYDFEGDEAAHGTVTRHYKQHQQVEKTSTNPIASIFAWTRGLAFRAKLDNNYELMQFCKTLEKVCIDTVESGEMTKNLALCIPGREVNESHYLTTEVFLNKLKINLAEHF
jgi:isocitrate dehydrogenase